MVGDYSARVTPVPIPNTVVKPRSADGTASVAGWESTTSPAFSFKNAPPHVTMRGAFLRYGPYAVTKSNNNGNIFLTKAPRSAKALRTDHNSYLSHTMARCHDERIQKTE